MKCNFHTKCPTLDRKERKKEAANWRNLKYRARVFLAADSGNYLPTTWAWFTGWKPESPLSESLSGIQKKKKMVCWDCRSTWGAELLKSQNRGFEIPEKEGTGFVFRSAKTSYPRGILGSGSLWYSTPCRGLLPLQGQSVRVRIAALCPTSYASLQAQTDKVCRNALLNCSK